MIMAFPDSKGTLSSDLLKLEGETFVELLPFPPKI